MNKDPAHYTATGQYNMKSDSYIQQEPPQQSPQGEGAQQFLDNNFSDVMRSSTIGSNVSSLLNTTTLTTAQKKQKIMLDWVLPDGKSSQLEMLTNKHIADFPAPGGNTGAMLIKLPDLEPFYNTSKFLVQELWKKYKVAARCKGYPTPSVYFKNRRMWRDPIRN